jgi:hypothetical protein
MVCRRPHGLLEASWFVGGVTVCRRGHGLLKASWFVALQTMRPPTNHEASYKP